MEKNIILAYPGCGKTYLVSNYSNVVDNDFCYFKFLYDKPVKDMTDEELEARKGNKEVERDNPDYPNNLISETFKNLEDGKVVLIPLSKGTYNIFKALEKEGLLKDVKVTMIYPSKEDLSSFIERYKGRGNGDVFMTYNHIVNFDEWLKIFGKEKVFNKVNIKPNEYLEDVLKRVGIELISK